MTKKFLIAAMGAAIVAGANAQAPVLNHVKSLDEPFVGVSPNIAVLSGAGYNPSDVAIVGDNMFYTTWSGGGTGTVNLIRVTNWNKPNATWEIYGTAPGVGAARNSQLITDPTNSNRIWWSTNMGSGTAGFSAAVRRVKTNGTALTDWLDLGTDALADGVIDNTEAQILVTGQWTAATVNPMCVSFDPGFGANPTPALALSVFGSYMIRRVDVNTGRMLLTDGVAVPKAGWLNNGYRDFDFDESGNLYAKINNNIYFQNRTEQGQLKAVSNTPAAVPLEYVGGFGGQTLISTPDLTTNSNTGNNALSNVTYVPAAPGQDAFLMANNRPNPNGDFKLALIPTTGGAATTLLTTGFNSFGQILNIGGAGIIGADWADVNGQRYIAVASFKSSVQGVDIYQIGDAGKISGSVTLEGWVGGANFLSQNFTVEVRDLSDNLLDRRTFAGGATATNFSFFTTARGAVTITIDGSTFLKRRLDATIGAAETVFNTTLLNGDVDGDAEVGPGDFEAVVSGFGLPFGDPNYVAAADLDKDGEIGPSDFELVVNNFGLGDE